VNRLIYGHKIGSAPHVDWLEAIHRLGDEGHEIIVRIARDWGKSGEGYIPSILGGCQSVRVFLSQAGHAESGLSHPALQQRHVKLR